MRDGEARRALQELTGGRGDKSHSKIQACVCGLAKSGASERTRMEVKDRRVLSGDHSPATAARANQSQRFAVIKRT